MASLIKNQVLKHLTKFFKDLAPEQLQLSAFKGSCELSNLQLEEKVLMDLLSFPAWIRINRAVCDQLVIRIPWTKIKSVPIQMNLNEVTVEVEVCEEFRDIDSKSEDELNLSNLINTQAPSKYGFVDRVIDGITVTVNNVLITFKSKIMSATFNLSRVVLESRCPNWKAGELSLTRIKDPKRGQILLFKIVDWQTMRLEAKCLTDPDQAPLRLITNHAQCRLTIKKNLDDCSVVAARIFVIFEDILWVLTFAQFTSAASFVEYIFNLIKRSPMSKKTGLLKDESSSSSSGSTSHAATSSASSSQNFAPPQAAPFISPLNTPVHTGGQIDKVSILSGNLSSSSLLEQKFRCYDILETSLHLYIDKIDAHLYDDIEISATSKNARDSGGALQTTLDQIQVDCYPYSRAVSDRRHWYKWFDPSPNTRKQWLRSHFAEFDLAKVQRERQEPFIEQAAQTSNNQSTFNIGLSSQQEQQQQQQQKPQKQDNNIHIPTSTDERLLSLTVLVKIKDYCMNCVATRHSMRGAGLNKFIQTDNDYQMPSEMPSLYLELNYFYYFDAINRMMVYDNVPDPLAYMHLSPTKLLFDSPTLVFLNSFHVNLSKAFVHLNDLFPEEKTAPKIHCRVEILMPQIILPAKSNNEQPNLLKSSSLLVKSGKITLSSSLYDKEVISKLLSSIERLKDNPSEPINMGSSSSYQSGAGLGGRRDNSCTGDWTKVWNSSLVDSTYCNSSKTGLQNQLWTIQFEPVWMDFMNYDSDDQLSSGQRLEPIVEPVNAYAFIHLDLSSTFPNEQPARNESHSNLEQSLVTTGADVAERTSGSGGSTNTNNINDSKTDKRDVISILFSVIDSSILANMDKVQFGFLQRLGMHVEKLIHQIREDASSIIQMDTVVEDTLEVNLTAYIRDIKARLILEKKIEMQTITLNDSFNSSYNKEQQNVNDKQQTNVLQPPAPLPTPKVASPTANITTSESPNTNKYFSNLLPTISNPFEVTANKPTAAGNNLEGSSFIFSPDQSSTMIAEATEHHDLHDEPLDECVEVADDASCLFLGAGDSSEQTSGLVSTGSSVLNIPKQQVGGHELNTSSSVATTGTGASVGSLKSSGKSPIEESLLINLDEMEQSSQLFAKMDVKSSCSPRTAGCDTQSSEQADHQPPAQQQQQQQQQQDIETESVSYLELSMSQLMVRRITETKRRQKF